MNITDTFIKSILPNSKVKPVQNIMDIKVQNIYRILNAIRFNDELTKKDIASETGLSFATVSNLCRELIAKKLVLEVQADKSYTGIGRLPNNVQLNYNEFFGVCIDMQRSGHITLALTNLRNEIVIKMEVRLRKHDSTESFVEECYRVCEDVCKQAGIKRESLLGLCIAVPAIYDSDNGVTVGVCEGQEVPLLEGKPIKYLFSEAFSLPVFVDNDANIASMSITSNHTHGLDGCKNLIYIHCSEGLGVGIIVDKKQLVGCSGYAAEVCHIPIGSEKLTCKLCGSTGCVERDLTISGFVSKYMNIDAWGSTDLFDKWENFLSAVDSGDVKATEVVGENAKIFGNLVSILVNLFDPEIVYIGGNVSVLFEKMKKTIEAEVKKRLISRSSIRAVLLQDDDKNTIVHGCAETIFKRINFASL